MGDRAALDTVTLIAFEMEQEAKATEDPERLLELLEAIRAMKGATADACRAIEGLVSAAFDGVKDTQVGPYQVTFRWGKQRRWSDNEGLVSAVRRMAQWDQQTGEQNDAETFFKNLTSAFRLSGDNVRTTWLRDHDIDPDDYSDGPYKCSIQLIRGSNGE